MGEVGEEGEERLDHRHMLIVLSKEDREEIVCCVAL